jgi:hypothetical protein
MWEPVIIWGSSPQRSDGLGEDKRAFSSGFLVIVRISMPASPSPVRRRMGSLAAPGRHANQKHPVRMFHTLLANPATILFGASGPVAARREPDANGLSAAIAQVSPGGDNRATGAAKRRAPT